MNIQIKPKRVLLWIVLGLLFFNLFAKRCSNTNSKSPKVTVIKDTIWQTKTDTFKIQTIKYKKVYVHKKNVQQFAKDTIKIDTSQYQKAKIYQDTLSNKDIDIYTYNLLDGKLLDSKLSYKLKVPKEITITKTIEHPKTYRSGLYIFSEIGGNIQKFDNASLGLQYNRKGKWFVSYRFNLNQLNQPTHNVGVGFRLFD